MDFHDNHITEVLDEDNVFMFRTSYEIALNNTVVKYVTIDNERTYHLHLYITDTVAQGTFNEFITDIAQTCGVKGYYDILTTIEIPFKGKIYSKVNEDVSCLHNCPYSLLGKSVDVIIDFKTFSINNNRICAKLTLSELHIIDYIYCPKLHDHDLGRFKSMASELMMLAISTNSSKKIERIKVPKLYEQLEKFMVNYELRPISKIET